MPYTSNVALLITGPERDLSEFQMNILEHLDMPEGKEARERFLDLAGRLTHPKAGLAMFLQWTPWDETVEGAFIDALEKAVTEFESPITGERTLSLAYRRLGENMDDHDYRFEGPNPDHEAVDYAHCLLPSWIKEVSLLDFSREFDAANVPLALRNEIMDEALKAAREVVSRRVARWAL